MKASLRNAQSIAVTLVSALALAGCAKKIESPKVGLTKVEPNLVCNAQRLDPDAVVNLTGSGFTPMPTNVLAEPSILILPEVMIEKTQDLAGKDQSGSDVTFPGEPEQKLSNNIYWKSATEMSIRISDSSPAVDLDPGLYDVTVTQPDGHTKAQMQQALAVVPPPRIDAVTPVPPAVCTAQGARKLTVSGSNFLVVAGEKSTVTLTDTKGKNRDLSASQIKPSGCSAIPGNFAGGKVELCDTLTLTLDDGMPPVGAFTVTVTSPAPASCASVESPSVFIAPPPTVDSVMPPTICVDQSDQTLTISGGNFAEVTKGTSGIPTVEIISTDGSVTKDYMPTLSGCAVPDGLTAGFGVRMCDTIEITVPMGDLSEGDYELVVTNPDPLGCNGQLNMALHVNAPPDVTSVTPAKVCSGGSILNVTGKGFEDGATAFLDCNTSGSVQAVSVDVQSATSATVTFGAGVAVGDSCDVVFVNADGCEDRPLPHETVAGVEGPILFNVDPQVAYSGIDTRVNLYVTALDGSFSVTMWPDGDSSSPVTLDSQLAPGKTTVIQAIIPAGTAASPAGSGYTMQVNDQSGCLAVLENAVRVTDTLVVQNGSVSPSFGLNGSSTAITITLASDPGSSGVPRAFLNPTSGNDPAIQLQSVTSVDAMTLTAIVPANAPVGTYDLVVVWPDGNVAVISDAYQTVSSAPPVVDNVSPQSVESASGQQIVITGSGFSGSSVSLQCLTSAGNTVDITATAAAEVCAAGSCSQTATFDASSAGQAAACVVRVTNSDGTYGEFSAIATSNASLNLSVSPTAGPNLNTGRRALVAAGVRASAAARYVYAIGGDDGSIANAMKNAEFSAVDLFGNPNGWVNASEQMNSKRTFAASTSIGRYIYVVGGNDGSGSVASAERALVLSPDEIPTVTNVDLCLSGGSADCFGVAGLADGLVSGVYSYRVAALIDAADPVNLGGETLASDPIILRLRDVDQRLVSVRFEWTAPVDSEGTELSGITGYRIYRTPVDGSPGTDEVLLTEVDAATLSFIDDGTENLGSAQPLPVGSTSSWQALPNMGASREGLAVVSAMEPTDSATRYLYALMGQDGGTPDGSYEFLTITLQSNGRQTFGSSWTDGTATSASPRYDFGAWRVDDSVSAISSGDTYIYVGSGNDSGGPAFNAAMEVAMVQTGGQLDAFDDAAVADVSPGNGLRSGYGAVAVGTSAHAKLYLFGGRTGMSGAYDASAYGAVTPWNATPFPDVSWNAEGGFTMTTARAFMGTTIQSANVFMIGGSSNGTNALASTEHVVW